jgi:hypothetical protein
MLAIGTFLGRKSRRRPPLDKLARVVRYCHSFTVHANLSSIPLLESESHVPNMLGKVQEFAILITCKADAYC